MREEDFIEEADAQPANTDWEWKGWRLPTGTWTFSIHSIGVARTKKGDPYLSVILQPEDHAQDVDPEELAAFELNGRGAVVQCSIFEWNRNILEELKLATGNSDSLFMAGRRFTAHFSRDCKGYSVLTCIRSYRPRVKREIRGSHQ